MDGITDDFSPLQQSILCATEEERTLMGGTEQTGSWVARGVRTGGLPTSTDGF